MGKKLLIVSQRFWPEENNINELARYFADQGVKVDVLCGKPNYPKGRFYEGYSLFGNKEEKYGGITVCRAAEIKKQGAFQMRPLLNYASFGISSGFRLRKLKQNQYDAVFIYQTSPVFLGRAGLKLAAKRKIQSVMFVDELWPDAVYKEMDIRDPILKGLFRKISYGQYKKAGRLITASKEAQRFLVKEIAQTPGEVVYVPAFPHAGFGLGKRDDKVSQKFAGSFNLLYIGEIKEKGPHEIFLETAQKLISAGLRDIRFIIAGEGDGFDALKKEIDALSLYDSIFPVGSQGKESLAGYIYAADALLCADEIDVSISYMAPTQVIDCLGCGKPILAAVDGEGKDIIRKAGCGLVSEPEDAQGLFDNIVKMYKTPKSELEKMGEKGKLFQLRNYDFETSAEQIMNIIFPDD